MADLDNDFTPEAKALMEDHNLSVDEFERLYTNIETHIRRFGYDAIDAIRNMVVADMEAE